MSAIFSTTFAICFTYFVLRFDTDSASPVSTLEAAICVYMTGSLAMEISQLLDEGVDYINDSWNMLDVSALILFWVAFVGRLVCWQAEGGCLFRYVYDDRPGYPDESWPLEAAKAEIEAQIGMGIKSMP